MEKQSSTHIKYNKENQIYTIQYHQNGKKPPCSVPRKQQCETSSRVIQQKAKFFPQSGTVSGKLGDNPNDQTQHTRETRVTYDNKETHDKEWPDRFVEGVHRIRGQGESKIVEGRL